MAPGCKFLRAVDPEGVREVRPTHDGDDTIIDDTIIDDTIAKDPSQKGWSTLPR